ncbi:MAG: S16 family serine protease [Candidatus Woesearchaeota archaeon]
MKKKRVKKKINEETSKSYKLTSAALVIFLLLVGIVIGAIGQNYVGFIKDVTPVNIDKTKFETEPGTIYIKVPAVDNEGNGVYTKLGVKIEEGSGNTLVDIDSLLFWVDTQNSIRMAKLVAEETTGINTENYDITYIINADASLIGGESAGSALTIATIAALQNKELRDDVMITGTVNHDGSIGPIGGVLQKAQAAKSAEVKTLLVPLLQSREVTYEETEHCEQFGLLEWCTIERIPVQINIAEETGLEIIEVGTIKDALTYLIKEDS